MRRFVPAVALVVLAATPGLAASAPTQTVSCGQVITSDTRLANDLVDCPADGLVIGADGVTLDLNGHTIAGRSGGDSCTVDCLGHYGIDSRGHDRLTVRNGTVRQFVTSVLLRRTSDSTVRDLRVGEGPYAVSRVGILLLNSDRNRLLRVRAGGDPAIMLWSSAGNTIAKSAGSGGISIRQGTGLVLAFEANRNRVVDTKMSGAYVGFELVGSSHNRIARSRADGYVGNRLSGNGNVVVDNELGGGRTDAVSVVGDRNRVARNQATGDAGVSLDGDENVVAANDFAGPALGAVGVRAGDRNVVRSNHVAPFWEGSYAGLYPIRVRPEATRTEVVRNTVIHAEIDGLLIEAPGTIVGQNVSNDNGELGINAVPGVIDAGGNRASGNGNPLQCVNIVCQASGP
jgi:large repetitive protein